MTRVQRSFAKKLNDILDDVFAESDRLGYSMGEMADIAGLCYQTVVNLNNRKTKLPRFLTVMKLVRAMDMDLEVVKQKLKRRAA